MQISCVYPKISSSDSGRGGGGADAGLNKANRILRYV